LGEADLEDLLEGLEKTSPWARAAKMRWKKASVLIIDECSMIHPELFEKLERYEFTVEAACVLVAALRL